MQTVFLTITPASTTPPAVPEPSTLVLMATDARACWDAAYNHALHLKGRAKMMQDWADYLEHTQRGAKVLSFPDRTA